MNKSNCLVPFDRSEALSLKQASDIAGKSVNTMRNWCEAYGIGRLIAGRWCVSRVALAMLLDGDDIALAAYLDGDRVQPLVASYFRRFLNHSQNVH